MSALNKWPLRTLWVAGIMVTLSLCVLVLTKKSHRKQVVETSAEQNDWKHFVDWKSTEDFTNSRKALLKIVEDAKKRGDFNELEIQTLIGGMQSTQAYMREMSLTISQRAMSENSKTALKTPVIKLIKDELPTVRQEAIIALYFVGTHNDVTNLDSAISDTDVDVAAAANRIKLKLSKH